MLAYLYLSGESDHKLNHKKAIKWLNKSFEQKNELAIGVIKKLYEFKLDKLMEKFNEDDLDRLKNIELSFGNKR
jgi:TPR repeat protein